MKHVAIAALLLVLIPAQAAALDTSELLGLVAMPLAVAAVSNVTGVPASELSNLVATLNRANMPPTQVVQVVRYAPAALVVETEQPTFVEFVTHEVDRGVTGPALVTTIERRLVTYDVEPRIVTLREPATRFVVADNYIPPMVVTRVAEVRPMATRPLIGDTNDLLALVAMPLAVAAVAEMANIPPMDLATLVSTLNHARLAPVQIVEVLRYAPVAYVADDGTRFVQFVQTQVTDHGIVGPRLVNVIEDRFRTYDVTPQLALAPSSRITVVDENFFPPVVRTRIADGRHPHGGPPGQLKKTVGVQTGAEIVHGQHPAARVAPRGNEPAVRREARRDEVRRETRRPERPKEVRREPVRRVEPAPGQLGRGGPKVDPPGQRKKDTPNMSGGAPQGGPPAGNPGKGQGQGQGGGKGKGKGKG